MESILFPFALGLCVFAGIQACLFAAFAVVSVSFDPRDWAPDLQTAYSVSALFAVLLALIAAGNVSLAQASK